MKSLVLLSLVPTFAFGSARDALKGLQFEGTDKVCAKRIATAVYKAAAKQFGPETAETINILSVKPVAGKFDETSIVTAYFVEMSDEVDPSQWLVVAETEDCVIEYVSQSK
jgi:hypothetical protein